MVGDLKPNLECVSIVIFGFSDAGSGLVKFVVMTNVFFNNQQDEIKVKWLICIKEIGLVSSVTTETNVQNVKTGLYRKLTFQSKFSSSTS